MNKQTFINLIKDPTKISAEHIHGLEEVAANFPFCQIAHMLIAKGSNDYGSMHAEMKLKKAVAYAIERKKLRELIFKKAEKEKSISEKTFTTVLPINKIPAITKENLPSEENRIKDKQKFYANLEENLRLLHSLKSGAGKPVEKQKEISEEPLAEHPSVTENHPVAEKLPEIEKVDDPVPEILQEIEIKKEPVEEPSDLEIRSGNEPIPLKGSEQEDLKNTLTEPKEENKGAERELAKYSTRLEDVFLEETGLLIQDPTETDLMLDYLKFLNQSKAIHLTDKKKQDEIITRFIKEDPSIPPIKPNSLPENQEDLASASSKINKTPASENFAKILLLQGKKEKAIEIYEQLILKYPEKSSYFASQIEKIKS